MWGTVGGELETRERAAYSQGCPNWPSLKLFEVEKSGFTRGILVFCDSGWDSAVQNCEVEFQVQLAIVQPDQGGRGLERFIQPGLQIAVNKELLP